MHVIHYKGPSELAVGCVEHAAAGIAEESRLLEAQQNRRGADRRESVSPIEYEFATSKVFVQIRCLFIVTTRDSRAHQEQRGYEIYTGSAHRHGREPSTEPGGRKVGVSSRTLRRLLGPL